MSIFYSVKFKPGRYKIAPFPANRNVWTIGREDDGVMIGFATSENDAKHICLALNLVEAQINGFDTETIALLKSLEKLRN